MFASWARDRTALPVRGVTLVLSDSERAMLMGGATAKAYGRSPKKA